MPGKCPAAELQSPSLMLEPAGSLSLAATNTENKPLSLRSQPVIKTSRGVGRIRVGIRYPLNCPAFHPKGRESPFAQGSKPPIKLLG